MSVILRREQNHGVLRITLNDPQSRNSLSDAMLTNLSEALTDAETDQTVSVIVIAADGPAFCSGHNLKELTARRSDGDRGASYFEDTFSRCSKLMIQITTHRCAVIAEITGLASAAGCQLVASCDLAYAGHEARFCTPGVNIGLFCSTPMTALSRSVGRKHAMEMLLTGDVYDAQYANRVGLINAVVAAQDLSSHVNAIAEKISLKSATAISYGKKLFHKQTDLPLSEAYRLCSEVMVANMLDDEACEGIGAFLEKRRANWQNLSKP